ncbi:MAG TPA: formylglycine-generating enzyme family protein, partial [Nitrospiraceae bacterium]|nr:formylglycine-generating enzyme family protein [Nitrospiraceae bacterium]
EGVMVQYAGSIVRARLHLVQVPQPEMITIAGGTFQRGDKTEGAIREVTIKPFAMGKYEVTFEEYDRYVELTGSKRPDDHGWGRGRRPVINVSWDDAKAYAKWLSQATGRHYRLPTESEWEYAARSGGQDEFWAGTSDERNLQDYAVFDRLIDKGTESVGTKQPNGLGLYDMSGNVWEWVEDCWHDNYAGAPEDGSAWLESGGGDCGARVVRGGSWGYSPVYLRASSRGWHPAGLRGNAVGFRLVQDIP